MSTTCAFVPDFLVRIQQYSLIILLHAKQVTINYICSFCVVHTQLTHSSCAGGQGKQKSLDPNALPVIVGIREND